MTGSPADRGTGVPGLAEVREAAARIRELVRRTPLLDVGDAVSLGAAGIHLKLENLQETGSFKVRGAANRILALAEAGHRGGVVACSSGNHGRAVAWVAGRAGLPATIFVPRWVDPVKLEGIRRAGAEVVRAEGGYDEAEERAKEAARRTSRVLVHPFDDPEVIAGQGTVGLEILEALERVDTVVVPVSGGGLMAGVIAAMPAGPSRPRLLGVAAEKAPGLVACLAAGEIVPIEERETLASALSGGIDPDNRHTFDMLDAAMDEAVLVTEEEIGAAMRWAATEAHVVVEGGGAVGLAAVLSGRIPVADRRIAVVISGGNVDPGILARVLDGASAEEPPQ